MKVKYEFAVREIAGEIILVPLGMGALKFSGMITVNDVGAFLWECLQSDVTIEELQKRVMDEFDVDEETARQDTFEFVEKIKKLNLLSE